MILVFGKNGQVATALGQILTSARFLSSQEADFLNPESCINALNTYQPKVVINASAYTMVDKAETEKENSEIINATTPGHIAKWCFDNNALLVHYSTDYVFDGSGEKPWTENDLTNPVNHYGLTKLHGEQRIQSSNCQLYIFRVSWVYSPWGNNFKKTILRLAQEREELKIVADQWGSPTQAEDIAKETVKVIEKYKANKALPFGVYHWRFSPYMTWFDFARQIVEQGRADGLPLKVKNILPIKTEDFPTPAKRPKNSRLDNSKYTQALSRIS